MDEPFGAIDPITRAHLQDQFLDLQQRLRKTVVVVTHDLDEAIRLGDRIALLRQGGHLEQYATPAELMGTPASPFVADFVGYDRHLRRLGVVPVRASDAEAARPDDTPGRLAVVRVGESLRSALVAVLRSPTGRAQMLDDAGASVGVITASAILAAARRSIVAVDRPSEAESRDPPAIRPDSGRPDSGDRRRP
jgi:osmoprotectant transport system ATP-binding protein